MPKYCPLRDGQCVEDKCAFNLEGRCAITVIAVNLHAIQEKQGAKK